MLALQGKLTESKESEKQILSDIDSIIDSFDSENYNYRYKGCDAEIKGNVLKMYYQTQEDIDRDDVEYICNEMVPYIKRTLKDNENNVTSIEITFYDRSGRYEDGILKKTFKVTPTVPNTVKNNSKTLDEGVVKQLTDLCLNVDYDWSMETVDSCNGKTIYEEIKTFFSPDSYYTADINKYCKNKNIDISDIDFGNKELIKPLALSLIKRVCRREGWSIPKSKEICGY